MRAPELTTEKAELTLIAPDVERDAPLSVGWLAGQPGRETLRLMGVTEADNQASSLDQERARVRDFLERRDQLNWMLDLAGTVVGAIWVDLEPREQLPAPSVHLMIGDPAARGQGLGGAALRAVTGYLRSTGSRSVYSRHTLENEASAGLLAACGFVPLGEAYQDSDGLHWQTVQRLERAG